MHKRLKTRDVHRKNQQRILQTTVRRLDETTPTVDVEQVMRIADAAGQTATQVAEQMRKLELAFSRQQRQDDKANEKKVNEFVANHSELARNEIRAITPDAAVVGRINAEPPSH